MKLQKALILIAIPLAIGLFIDNFQPGDYQDNWLYKLYISFFNDLVFPFGLYFVFCLLEKWIPRLKPWQAKASLAFLVPACIEIGQLLYMKLGLTKVFMMYGGAFDPLDFVVYAAGGLLAVLLERRLFARHLKFWESKTTPLASS